MAADEFVSLLDIVNPSHDGGRVTLITRYGADKVTTNSRPSDRLIPVPVWSLFSPLIGV
ncbi:hypothetical protein BGW80DRAFT_1391914 [Lactifluus volemus]|nr:hypothetical protein BGW80DRAFT_1391914 [Lactifluus volemus]